MINQYAKNFSKNYSNGCEHSEYLRSRFNISNLGVDYYNDNNIGFEFKESFMERIENIFFKVPEVQALNSDYFVFCVGTSEYYIVPQRDILENFDFKTKKKNANIRINTVKQLACFKTDDIDVLEIVIDELEEKDE